MSHRSTVMVHKTYYHIAIMTMVVALVWTGITVYRVLTSPGEIVVDKNLLTPISATLDEEVLEKLQNRLDDVELNVASQSAEIIEDESQSIDEIPL